LPAGHLVRLGATPGGHHGRLVDPRPAYIDALKMLGRRELSEAQIRQRLARRKHDPKAIDAAVARLLDERAIDDNRVAEAIARTETGIRKRGHVRVRRKIESVGIPPAIARRAVDEVFGSLDADALLESALAKRLRRGTDIADEREFSRLYRYLVGQGFEADRVLALLKRNHKGRNDHED
jgi:regulatory protein